MQLAPGTRLGPYEILSPLGSGGMGEVYTARDTRLDRRVAIKIAKAQFSERFEREARAAAALNHPHICQLYDVGPNYLVMELVEGTPVGPVANVRDLLDVATDPGAGDCLTRWQVGDRGRAGHHGVLAEYGDPLWKVARPDPFVTDAWRSGLRMASGSTPSYPVSVGPPRIAWPCH